MKGTNKFTKPVYPTVHSNIVLVVCTVSPLHALITSALITSALITSDTITLQPGTGIPEACGGG